MVGIDFFGRGRFMGSAYWTAPMNTKWPYVMGPVAFQIRPATFAESGPAVEVEVEEATVRVMGQPAAPPQGPPPAPSQAECAVTCGIRTLALTGLVLAGGAVAWAAGAFGKR